MKKVLAGIIIMVTLICCAGCEKETIEDNTNNTNAESSQGQSEENLTTNVPQNESSEMPITTTAKCAECGRECDDGHTYCFTHECWEDGCLMAQKSMSSYCVNHSCLLCTSSRTFNSPYCSQHKCQRCENVVVEGSDYCVAHKCMVCDRQVSGNSQYCMTHN